MLSIMQRRDLSLVNADLAALAAKEGKFTKQDEVRYGQLKMHEKAILSGMTLEEIREERTVAPREVEVRGWKQLAEQRDMTEGSPLARLGSYSGLGFFVPMEFFPHVFGAMRAHDALFDPQNVTFISSSNGRPLPVPTYDDTENVASVVSEAGSQTSVDIDATGQAVLGAYSYSTPRFVCSLEAFDDIEGGVNIIDMFKAFSADRLARGIAADLMNGNGTGKTLGLLPSLDALGVTPVSASGSAANDGSANTGANSLGSDDFAAALNALDDAYANAPKCAWIMNKKTLANVASLKDKYGNIVNLVKYVDGVPTIYGIPVKIAPSMANIGPSNVPVVLGDFSYWATRLVVDDLAGVRVYREAPGLIENGNVGFRTFARAHGSLLYSGGAAQSPFTYIRNHS